MTRKIDILLATYNGEDYLPDQLNSLLTQSNQDWFLLIHDDGSTDKTVNIIKRYQNLYPDKIYYVDDKIIAGGAKNNFAHLMNLSTSDYIMFCDQDDIWKNNKVEITYKKMLELEKLYPDKPILIHTDLTVVDNELKLIAHSLFEYQKLPKKINNILNMIVLNNITGCTVMINKKAKEISLPIHKKAIMHDWWVGCKVKQNEGIIYFIDYSTILYRQHKKNSLGAKKYTILLLIKRIKSAIQIIKGYKGMAEALGINAGYIKLILKKIGITIMRFIRYKKI
ncbi:MAG: glycosyltransferase family 2 protein [Candidatus Carbobacillus altaicus]|nr:glycosyltransferase family 2 protein [Candidatus Carbobacillus altaicus]